MVSGLNLPPQSNLNVNFGKKVKSKEPEKKQDIIDQAYRITNDVPEEQKMFSPGADLAFPLVFALPYAYGRSNLKLNKLTRKLNRATKAGKAEKVAELTKKVNDTDKLIKEGVNIKSVYKPKEAFKEYGGKSMFFIYLAMEGMEVYRTFKELGTKEGLKQTGRAIGNALGSTVGWVAGSALAHGVAGKIGAAIGSIGGPVGRFVGNLVGTGIGFLGGMLGERLMNKAGEKIYGKSSLTQASEAKYEQDLKNIDLNDKTTLKQQIVKNQLWISQFADENGNLTVMSEKDKAKIETVSAASEELYNKFKAAGGTDEELKAAFEDPDKLMAEQATTKNDSNLMYYSGAFNSATAKGDPRFNGYNQRVFA